MSLGRVRGCVSLAVAVALALVGIVLVSVSRMF